MPSFNKEFIVPVPSYVDVREEEGWCGGFYRDKKLMKVLMIACILIFYLYRFGNEENVFNLINYLFEALMQ